jgi:hypothetical protein
VTISDSLPDLIEGEELLTDDAERIWRQVHPKSRTAEGAPSSAAFIPNQTDKGCLSCSREQIVTAEEAFVYHTRNLDLESAGSWSITVAAVRSVELRAVDDSARSTDESPLPPGHTYVDYRTVAGKNVRKKARILAHGAVEAYTPPHQS